MREGAGAGAGAGAGRRAPLVLGLLVAAALVVGGERTALSAQELQSSLVVDVADEVEQGELLRLSVSGPARLDEVSIELRTAAGNRRFTAAFSGGDGVWYALLGIDSTDAVGEATLTVRAIAQGGPVIHEQGIMVRAAQFRSRRIALDGALSSLRRTEDPRRAEQSRILWELLHEVDTTAVYHRGALRAPVADFRRTSEYGDRREFAYSDGSSARSIHYGVDFAAPSGTPIVASGGGRVAMARERIITGGTVVLEHLPGVFTVYYHLQRIDVEEGTYVVPGAPIGTVGSTGLSTGPHLHWELRVAGAAVDPERAMERPLVDSELPPGASSSSP